MKACRTIAHILELAQAKQVSEGNKPTLPVDLERDIWSHNCDAGSHGKNLPVEHLEKSRRQPHKGIAETGKQFMPHARRKGHAYQTFRSQELQRMAKA